MPIDKSPRSIIHDVFTKRFYEYLVNPTLPNYPNKLKLHYIQQTQWLPEEKLKDLQLEGLKQLVNWAIKKVPYYHNFSLINSLDDLKQYPVLTKKLIHDNFHAMIARDKRLLSIKKSTGGTTSQSTIMCDLNFYKAKEAGVQRFRSWYDIDLKKTCHLWGGYEIGFIPKRYSRDLYLPVEGMTNRRQAIRYLNMIKDFSPDYLDGYTLPLVALAHYELEEHVAPQIGVITCNCETLLPWHRKLIEKAFRCHVYNFYSSQDLGAMAQDCINHQGLHINAERYILETTEDGHFLFTDLLNYSMPIIRYEIGDMGKFLSRKCSCGRGLPLVEEVIGRTLPFILTKKGGWLHTTSLRQMAFAVKGFRELVDRYQLNQTEPGKVTLLIKPWKKEKLPDIESLKKIWLSDEIDIEIKIVDSIPLSKSGKQLAVVTEFVPPWTRT